MSHTTFCHKPDHSCSKYPQRSVLPDVAKSFPVLLNPTEMWQRYGHVENSWNQQFIHIHTSDEKALKKNAHTHTLQHRIKVKYSAYLLKNVFACINLFHVFHTSHTHTCTLTSRPTFIKNFLANYLNLRNKFWPAPDFKAWYRCLSSCLFTANGVDMQSGSELCSKWLSFYNWNHYTEEISQLRCSNSIHAPSLWS
jgi:hypothetical protein